MVLVPPHDQAKVGAEMDQSVEHKGETHDLERENLLALRPCLVVRLDEVYVDLVRCLGA